MQQHSNIILVGGTFDPPHKRHATLIGSLARLAWVDQVVVMPVKQNPLKSWPPMFSFAQRVAMINETLKWFEPDAIDNQMVSVSEVAMQLPSPSHVSDALDLYKDIRPAWRLWLYLPAEACAWINIEAVASRCPRGVFANDGNIQFGTIERLMKSGFSSLTIINLQDPSELINSMRIRQEIKQQNMKFLDQAPVCPFVRDLAKHR